MLSSAGDILNSKLNNKKISYINSFLEQIDLQDENVNQIETFKVKLNWVYGFRCDDMIKNFEYHVD